MRQINLIPAAILCVVFGAAAMAAPPADPPARDRMAIAQAQHDLIVLLVDRGEFDKVPAEMQKILDLGFTGKDENRVVDEILILSDLLSKKGQPKIALRLVDLGLAGLKEKTCLARLYKEKGFLFKSLGQPDKAMEMFEKGRALEATGGGK